MNHILKSQLEIATARAAAIVKVADRQERDQQRRVAWQRRLDPASYLVRREADAWIAECPAAGQRFEYRLIERFTTGHASIAVASQSGEQYILQVHQGRQCVCSCPAFNATEVGQIGCKHSAGWKAVRQAAKMERTLAPATLRAQAA